MQDNPGGGGAMYQMDGGGSQNDQEDLNMQYANP